MNAAMRRLRTLNRLDLGHASANNIGSAKIMREARLLRNLRVRRANRPLS